MIFWKRKNATLDQSPKIHNIVCQTRGGGLNASENSSVLTGQGFPKGLYSQMLRKCIQIWGYMLPPILSRHQIYMFYFTIYSPGIKVMILDMINGRYSIFLMIFSSTGSKFHDTTKRYCDHPLHQHLHHPLHNHFHQHLHHPLHHYLHHPLHHHLQQHRNCVNYGCEI